MVKTDRRMVLVALSLFAFVGLSQIVMESYVDARAGGGRSGGFRGSRSYNSPSKPSQQASTAKTRCHSGNRQGRWASRRRVYARLAQLFGRFLALCCFPFSSRRRSRGTCGSDSP